MRHLAKCELRHCWFAHWHHFHWHRDDASRWLCPAFIDGTQLLLRQAQRLECVCCNRVCISCLLLFEPPPLFQNNRVLLLEKFQQIPLLLQPRTIACFFSKTREQSRAAVLATGCKVKLLRVCKVTVSTLASTSVTARFGVLGFLGHCELQVVSAVCVLYMQFQCRRAAAFQSQTCFRVYLAILWHVQTACCVSAGAAQQQLQRGVHSESSPSCFRPPYATQGAHSSCASHRDFFARARRGVPHGQTLSRGKRARASEESSGKNGEGEFEKA
jgi:hypothetical protein